MGWINGGNCGLCDVKHICCDEEFEEEDDDKTDDDDDDEAGNSKCENGVLEMGHVFGAVSDGSGGIFRSGSVNPENELKIILFGEMTETFTPQFRKTRTSIRKNIL